MKNIEAGNFKQKVKVKEQITGTIGLTRQIDLIFYKIINEIFK